MSPPFSPRVLFALAVSVPVWVGPRAVGGRPHQAAAGHSGGGTCEGCWQRTAGKLFWNVIRETKKFPWCIHILNSREARDKLHLNCLLIACGCVRGEGTLTSKELRHLHSKGENFPFFFSSACWDSVVRWSEMAEKSSTKPWGGIWADFWRIIYISVCALQVCCCAQGFISNWQKSRWMQLPQDQQGEFYLYE